MAKQQSDESDLDRVVQWVRDEMRRQQLSLSGGSRANLSLSDASVLVTEIDRLRAVVEELRAVVRRQGESLSYIGDAG